MQRAAAYKDTETVLQSLAKSLDELLTEKHGRKGFALLIFPLGAPEVANYTGNVERAGAVDTLRETAERIERGQTIPPAAIDHRPTEKPAAGMARHRSISHTLRALAMALDEFLTNEFGHMGFVLTVFDFGAAGVGDYITNVDDQTTMTALRETAKRIEKGPIIPPAVGAIQ